jgi:hypothetical protein
MPDSLELFPGVDLGRDPPNGGCAQPIGRRRSRYRPAPARTVLQRALWERRFAALGTELTRLSALVARLEKQMAAEHRQAQDNAAMLELINKRLTQVLHDRSLRQAPSAVPQHSRKRPLGHD